MTQKEEIREVLHRIIDQVEDEKILGAVYTILEKEVKQFNSYDLNDEQKDELDQRVESHKNGKTKSYSWEEAKLKIRSQI